MYIHDVFVSHYIPFVGKSMMERAGIASVVSISSVNSSRIPLARQKWLCPRGNRRVSQNAAVSSRVSQGKMEGDRIPMDNLCWNTWRWSETAAAFVHGKNQHFVTGDLFMCSTVWDPSE